MNKEQRLGAETVLTLRSKFFTAKSFYKTIREKLLSNLFLLQSPLKNIKLRVKFSGVRFIISFSFPNVLMENQYN